MYIQITTRCNMTCAHCCFRCTSKGTDMDYGTFAAAVDLCAEYGETISIGGGEPTVHREFWDMLDYALEKKYIDYVWMATNGKRKRDAFKLLEYMEIWSKDKFSVELSQDRYHNPIDGAVVSAFQARGRDYNAGEFNTAIRDVSHDIKAQGRAVDNGISDSDGCACDTLFIDPEGSIWNCGCMQTKFGTVWNPAIPEEYHAIAGYDGGHDFEEKVNYCICQGIEPEDYQGMDC